CARGASRVRTWRRSRCRSRRTSSPSSGQHPAPAKPVPSLFAELRRAYAQVTVKLPFMIDACGSHTYVYLPAFSVTVQDFVPTKETPVFLSTPGPFRWKLWIPDLSAILNT